MKSHYITLPNGRKARLGVYVKAWQSLKTISPETLCPGFEHFPAPAEAILSKMRWGVNDRINRHIPHFGKGRKWSSDWERQAMHTAREVNTPRLIVRWIPFEFRKRLAHRLSDSQVIA